MWSICFSVFAGSERKVHIALSFLCYEYKHVTRLNDLNWSIASAFSNALAASLVSSAMMSTYPCKIYACIALVVQACRCTERATQTDCTLITQFVKGVEFCSYVDDVICEAHFVPLTGALLSWSCWLLCAIALNACAFPFYCCMSKLSNNLYQSMGKNLPAGSSACIACPIGEFITSTGIADSYYIYIYIDR